MTPDTEARLALLTLPKMGPARLAWLLAAGEAPELVEVLRRGQLPAEAGQPPPGVNRTIIAEWHGAIRTAHTTVEKVLAASQAIGARVLSPLEPGWPLADDPEPPGLLFTIGDLDLFDGPTRVAVVGTRRCTAIGRTVAHRLGSDLARAGGVVVSGLALGVDGAAHRGCLDHEGLAIGVVGGGLDVVYPRANRALWDEVAGQGLLVSEVPTSVRPERWRFPARNRLIAAFSQAVVVVESHDRGGALSTADEALRRDRPVMAVPGSVLSPAARGTNALLVDGAIPVRDASDVLAYLGHPSVPAAGQPPDDAGLADRASQRGAGESDVVVQLGPRRRARSQPPPTPPPIDDAAWPPESVGGRILAEVAAASVHLDQLVLVTGRTVADVLAVVQELQAAGLVQLDGSTVVLVKPHS